MKEHFILNTGIQEIDLNKISSIIHNSANSVFLENSYSPKSIFSGDFITIRPMDNPKYGVDIVHRIAVENEEYKFHILGKGSYFKDKDIPKNVEIIEEFYSQSELSEVLNRYKFALMPTRLDAQGVMSCEMATFGIPLITSDIQICKEMLQEFSNVTFIDNKNPRLNKFELNRISNSCTLKNNKFNINQTVTKEIDLFKEFCK